MSTVNKNKTQGSNLPKPPKKDQKSWASKRVDNAMRALRAAKQLHERLDAGFRLEHRPDFAAQAKDALHNAATALAVVESAVKTLSALDAAGYKPETERVKLEVGTQVWIRGAVWRRKYHGLFQPEEMDGLEVVSISGKLVRARSTSGKEIVENSGTFRTRPVDYVAAAEEGEGQAA